MISPNKKFHIIQVSTNHQRFMHTMFKPYYSQLLQLLLLLLPVALFAQANPPTTSISFEEESYHFGEILEGEIVKNRIPMVSDLEVCS